MSYTRDSHQATSDARVMRNRVTMERNDAIRRLIRAGEPDAAIIRRYGIGPSTLDKLRGGAQ